MARAVPVINYWRTPNAPDGLSPEREGHWGGKQVHKYGSAVAEDSRIIGVVSTACPMFQADINTVQLNPEEGGGGAAFAVRVGGKRLPAQGPRIRFASAIFGRGRIGELLISRL